MSIGMSRGELLQVPKQHYSSTSGSEYSLATSREDSGTDRDRAGSAQSSPDESPRPPSPELPTIDFNINYFTATSTLNVTVLRVRNIPAQFRKSCAAYVKVSLKSQNKLKTKRFKTRTIRNNLNPTFDDELSFNGYDFQELQNYRIRLSAYARSRKLSKKVLIGDLFVPLARPDFEANSLLGCTERLSPSCPVTGRRGPQMMAGEFGFLQIELGYVHETRRLKVMVRKGQKLASPSSIPGVAEYYVVLSLLRNGESIQFRETRPALGANPSWNQAFLFYLDDGEPSEYWCQLLLMRGMRIR